MMRPDRVCERVAKKLQGKKIDLICTNGEGPLEIALDDESEITVSKERIPGNDGEWISAVLVTVKLKSGPIEVLYYTKL